VLAALAVQIRLPTETPQTFGLRIGGGFTTSTQAIDGFDLGYLPLVTGSLPTFGVRGFGIRQLTGQRALVGSLEYRLPPWNIERGLGNWPLFFDDLGITLFTDAGVVGQDSLDFSQTRFSLGAELRLSLTVLWLAPGSSLAFGVAQGIGEPGARVYLNFVLPTLLGASSLPQEPKLELPTGEP
jgi:hypothetical protein